MIARLRGEVLENSGATIVVDAGGVGYEVTLPESVALQVPAVGHQVSLLTRQIFREDGVSLYGFLSTFQRRLFDLLLEVKGCGPKVALTLIGQLGEDVVASSIVAQDTRSLSRATGVGPRLAERIIVELKDKIPQEQLVQRISSAIKKPGLANASDELVEALLALGYRRAESEAAAEGARQEANEVEEQIRIALRSLRK